MSCCDVRSVGLCSGFQTMKDIRFQGKLCFIYMISALLKQTKLLFDMNALVLLLLLQLGSGESNVTDHNTTTQLTSTATNFFNETSSFNSSSLNNFKSNHEPSTGKPDKIPVNWQYMAWPLLGSIILVSSIAWIVVKRKNGPRVLYMSRIPRIISPTPPSTARM